MNRRTSSVAMGVVFLAAVAVSGCVTRPVPQTQAPPVPAEDMRRKQAEANEAKLRLEAERAEQAALANKRAEAYAAEKQLKINALPAFRSQLKTGDRVKSSSGYLLGIVVELKRPLALVQLEIIEFPNRRFEMRWLPIDDLVPPDF